MSQKHTIISGAFILTGAGFLGRIIGFFYRIFLSRAIGAEGMGIYQLIFPLYALAFSLAASGIQTSISHFVSAKTASGDRGGARKIFHIGLFLSVSLSFGISALLLRCHAELAEVFVKEPRSSDLLRLLAYVIPFGSIHACINGYYYGLKRVSVPAFIEVLEHVVRMGSVLLLYRIWTQRGVQVTPALAVYGMIAEEFCAALFSATALTLYFYGQPPLPRAMHRAGHYLAELLTLSTPLTMNRVLINILQSIEALLIPLQLRLYGMTGAASLRVYGVLTGMALPLIMFPTALTSALCTMLLPVISEARATQRLAAIRPAVRKLCAACLALGLSCFCICFFFGNALGNLLFHNTLAGAFIRALAWICPLLYLNPALFSILNGLEKTSQVFLNNLTAVSIRIGFIFFAIPQIGISGYFLGTLANQLVLFALTLRGIRKYFPAQAG